MSEITAFQIFRQFWAFVFAFEMILFTGIVEALLDTLDRLTSSLLKVSFNSHPLIMRYRYV